MKTLNGKFFISGAQAPDVGRIKMSDKDDQVTKHYDKKNKVLWPGHVYQKF